MRAITYCTPFQENVFNRIKIKKKKEKSCTVIETAKVMQAGKNELPSLEPEQGSSD